MIGLPRRCRDQDGVYLGIVRDGNEFDMEISIRHSHRKGLIERPVPSHQPEDVKIGQDFLPFDLYSKDPLSGRIDP